MDHYNAIGPDYANGPKAVVEDFPDAPVGRINIYGMDLAELGALVARYEAKPYHAGQIFQWLYKIRVDSFAQMSNLSKKLRERLEAECVIEPPVITHRSAGEDGTVKYIFSGARGRRFEAVWLPFEERVAICISSQSGCSLECVFCATGKLPFRGNLTPGDIAGQVAAVERDMGHKATNVVLMGMGEPFYNYDNVIRACGIIGNQNGLGIGARKITISTSGVLPRIEQFIEEGHIYGLAVSLNHSHDDGRSRVMAINDRWDMGALRRAALAYNRATGNPLTFEYVMMAGENIFRRDAENLIEFLRGVRCMLNLIPLNTDFAGMRRPEQEEIDAFYRWLRPLAAEYRIPVINRRSPARGINGACGMLALKME